MSDNISGLMRALRRYVFADGRADIDETRSLIGLMGPLASRDSDFGELKRILEDIAADGIVTSEESERLRMAISAIVERESEAMAVRDVRKLGVPRMAILGLQHLLAMFGGTVVVPLLLGISPTTALFFCGIGTLLFHLVTRSKVPVFLGSSSAYLAGYFAVFGLVGTVGYENLTRESAIQYACIGVALSSIVYLVASVLIWKAGAKRVLRWLPPEVTMPIIISIGLVLAPIAVGSCTRCWPVAIAAALTMLTCNVFVKGMARSSMLLIALGVSYLASLAMGALGMVDQVDFSRVFQAAWIGLPVSWDTTVFPVLAAPDWGVVLSAVSMVVPLALVSVMEHIGDVMAISSTVNRDFVKDPGLHRTLLGDGLATGMAALFGAPANTTYSENTGVLSITRVYDPLVLRIAALMAIAMSFCPKLAALITTIPEAAVGGITLVLYGSIAMVGVRNLANDDVDLNDNRNVCIIAMVMALALGISFSAEGAIRFVAFGTEFALSGLAVAAVSGIVLNLLLPGKARR